MTNVALGALPASQVSIREACAQFVNAGKPGTPDEASPDWFDAAKDWVLINALLEGTPGMQAGASVWLPQEEGETPAQWYSRIRRSICFDMLKDAVDRLSSKPFSQPPKLRNDFESILTDSLCKSIDGAGTPLARAARDALAAVWGYGLYFGIVDMPTLDQVGASNLTPDGTRFNARAIADGSVRPYVLMLHPKDVIDIEVRKVGGVDKIQSFRFRRNERVSNGNFGYKPVRTVVRWSIEDVVTYEAKEDGNWSEISRARNPFKGEVRLRVLRGPTATGPFSATPPLLSLAYTNLAHYQSYSDQREALHTGRFSVLFQTGCVDEEEKDSRFAIGPRVGIRTTAPKTDASLEFVELEGKALEAGAKDIEELERRAETQGLTPFMKRTGQTTATERGMEEDGVDTDAVAMVVELEGFLDSLIRDAGELIKADLSKFEGVDIFTDFRVLAAPAEEYKSIQADRDRGDIGPKTLLAEGIRRGIYSGDQTVDDMIEDAQESAMPPQRDPAVDQSIPGDQEAADGADGAAS